MKRLLFVPLATLMLMAAACNNSATNPTSSGSLPAASAGASASAAIGSPSASARASGSAAASAAGSAGTVSKYVELQIASPEDGAQAGADGQGWMVTVLAKGHGPAMDQVQPAINFVNGVGTNPAFPGLVVLVTTTGGSGSQTKIDPAQNLAKLFQMIGLQNTGGGPVSVSGTSGGTTGGGATGATGSTGAGGATTGSASGTTGASSSQSGDERTVNATYYAQNARFGTDVDVEITAFVVEGKAPDTVSDRSSLRIVSNEVTVKFHINGSGQVSTTGGSATSTPAASPSGAASPSASPSSAP